MRIAAAVGIVLTTVAISSGVLTGAVSMSLNTVTSGRVLDEGAAALPAGTFQDATSLRMQTLNVSDELYLLSGGGGASLLMVTAPGAVLVDPKLPGWGRRVLETIAGATEKPIVTIVATHAHDDHAGAASEYADAREIIAHARAKPHLPATSAPVRTFDDTLTLFDGPDRVDLHYFGRGHTDGDIVVVFPAKRVAHVGDLFPAKAVPRIDAARGGSGLAYPDTLAKVVAALGGVSRVITGHGPPVMGSPIRGGLFTLADLKEYADFTREFVEAVKAAKQAGKSAEEAASTLALPDRYRSYDLTGAIDSVRTIYAELSR